MIAIYCIRKLCSVVSAFGAKREIKTIYLYNKPCVGHGKLRWIGNALVLLTNKLCNNEDRTWHHCSRVFALLTLRSAPTPLLYYQIWFENSCLMLFKTWDQIFDLVKYWYNGREYCIVLHIFVQCSIVDQNLLYLMLAEIRTLNTENWKLKAEKPKVESWKSMAENWKLESKFGTF